MKILNDVKIQITEYGYKKHGNSFWKTENGFYKLINFQTGAYGDYFFINVALHPDGMPVLSQRCETTKKPKESQCAFRWRIEQIAGCAAVFRGQIGFPQDADTAKRLIAAVMPEIESWLDKRGSYQAVLSADFDELSRSFSAVPILWMKEFLLLKSYCAFMRGDEINAARYFSAYLKENRDMDFSYADNYMKELLSSRAPSCA
ncbi:DUF4304 domain-containing protein [Cloacibacillus sp. An23]|uniref:DUF4304 domain-containing protein n=1 Tax=Cloacibacillus sp. An23 TaxID=1965591 RepID=UPI000B37CAE8|nr:DUF4304 domain-containing protein [Cloacibacillus sp. An23]OUO95096.1 hypothetical protein B5F39_00765 [Cloacibacillus sp. An23]